MSSKGIFTLTCLMTSKIISNWAQFWLGLSLLGKDAPILVVDPSTPSKGSAREFGVASGSDALGF